MSINFAARPAQKTARITGVLYLSLALLGPFSMLYVPSMLIARGDAAATAANVAASTGLLRLGMAVDGLVFLIEIVLTALLFALLKPVDETLSLGAAFSRLAMAVIQGANLLNYFFVLQLAGEGGQAEGWTLFFLNAHESMALIWGLFFGLHLCLLGFLVFKSGYMPALVGILLAAAGACYLAQSFGNILLPQASAAFAMIGMLSMVELAFPLWLVIKGVKKPNPTLP